MLVKSFHINDDYYIEKWINECMANSYVFKQASASGNQIAIFMIKVS